GGPVLSMVPGGLSRCRLRAAGPSAAACVPGAGDAVRFALRPPVGSVGAAGPAAVGLGLPLLPVDRAADGLAWPGLLSTAAAAGGGAADGAVRRLDVIPEEVR